MGKIDDFFVENEVTEYEEEEDDDEEEEEDNEPEEAFPLLNEEEEEKTVPEPTNKRSNKLGMFSQWTLEEAIYKASYKIF